MTPDPTPLDTLFARSLDGVVLVSPAGLIERANAAALTILAAPESDLIGSPIVRWLPELTVRTEHPQNCVETSMVSARMDRFYADVSIFPATATPGAVANWIVFRDISIRKGLEGSIREHVATLERLYESRTRELDELRLHHRHLYDQAPVLDFELDSELMIASANRKACVSLGVTNDRLVGLPISELAVPDKRDALLEALTAMMKGSAAPFETRLRGADGSVIDVVLHACRSEGSERSGLRCVGLDVTARREAERLVDQSLDLAEAQRARMERILRGIGEGVVVTDPDGQVRLMNSIAERFLDIDERFAFGRDLFAEQRDLEFAQTWRTFTAGDEDLAFSELTVGSAATQVFTVTMSRIRTPEGRPAGCVAVLRDITKERALDRMKTDFVSNLTHELRTPLASIRGFTATVLRGENVEEGDKIRFLEIVEKEAERLQSLIEDLLTLSRLEGGRDVLNLRPTDFTTILSDARDAFTSVAESRGVTLTVSGLGQNGAGVIDPEKMRRVVDNLVGNALKFTPLGGEVALRFARNGERLECMVRDTGRGIEPATLDRIFDRFYTNNHAGGNPEGTGLGLHIVKRLIELHGGEITAESVVGEGTTFRFFITAIPRTKAAPAPAPTRSADPLIDDDDMTEDVDSTNHESVGPPPSEGGAGYGA